MEKSSCSITVKTRSSGQWNLLVASLATSLHSSLCCSGATSVSTDAGSSSFHCSCCSKNRARSYDSGCTRVASNGSSPFVTRIKAAQFSKVLTPRRGTWSRSVLRCHGRAPMMLSHRAAVKDGTFPRISREHALMSTPTAATASIAVALNLSSNILSGRSCWYIPRPRLRGGIFTSSWRGFRYRRPILAAATAAGLSCGNSRPAMSVTLQTLAPASLTRCTAIVMPPCSAASCTSSRASLVPCPLPRTTCTSAVPPMSCTFCSRSISCRFPRSLAPPIKCTVSKVRTLPDVSNTAHLIPALKPGSSASTPGADVAGGDRSALYRLSQNTSMDFSSAARHCCFHSRAVHRLRSSRVHASCTASRKSACLCGNTPRTIRSARSLSTSNPSVRIFWSTPRRMAKT
mmetsp:Transcript_24364/g.48501  ORF Transcript_24364/g.48501 Transcript_24364/m.48501 type:complete len:402 (-) Transcript_24364:880-2085(-)